MSTADSYNIGNNIQMLRLNLAFARFRSNMKNIREHPDTAQGLPLSIPQCAKSTS